MTMNLMMWREVNDAISCHGHGRDHSLINNHHPPLTSHHRRSTATYLPARASNLPSAMITTLSAALVEHLMIIQVCNMFKLRPYLARRR